MAVAPRSGYQSGFDFCRLRPVCFAEEDKGYG